MADIRARLEALAAQPRSWCVVITYADGATRRHDTHSAAGAETYAVGERRKIGKDLIRRSTMKAVRVVSVEIVML